MSLKKVILTENDSVFIPDIDDNYGCGYINNDGHLYLIDRTENIAYMLPDEYKDTEIILYHPCGGYKDGLIMVSTLGELKLQYHHTFHDVAGMWGWLDIDGNVVIEPQYVYAMQFFDGRAIVCKGGWQVDDKNRYWCDNEQWGIINQKGDEIVPCQYDEIFDVENTERFILCHKNGWRNGTYCIYDIETQKEILQLDFNFDCGYMFNDCFYENGNIIFDNHLAGEEKDVLYVYSILEEKWIIHGKTCVGRELNGETKKVVVTDEGEEIIVF